MEILIITNCPKGGPASVVTRRINRQQQNPMWKREMEGTHTHSHESEMEAFCLDLLRVNLLQAAGETSSQG